MKPRDVILEVSDHAVLRYLERELGLDVEAVRAHIGGPAVNGAVLGALAVQTESVKLVLRTMEPVGDRQLPRVVVTTALQRWMAVGG